MKLQTDLFENEHITQLGYEDQIPKELTPEMYLRMYTKIWAIVRHDLWKDVQAKKKELRVNSLTEQEFEELYEAIYTRFETIRCEVYAKFMDDPEIEQDKAREFMQKAYVTYATISSLSKNEEQEAVKSRWPILVQKVAIEHGALIKDMKSGKYYDHIDRDPREFSHAEEKYDLKSLAAYKGLST